MPNWSADIVTPFVGSGADDDANRPLFGDDYAYLRWEDITGTPSAQLTPSPNLYVLRAEITEAVLDDIESDGIYLVLSSEEIIDASP